MKSLVTIEAKRQIIVEVEGSPSNLHSQLPEVILSAGRVVGEAPPVFTVIEVVEKTE